jgi:hypothetical protein
MRVCLSNETAWVGTITPMKGWDRLETLARRLPVGRRAVAPARRVVGGRGFTRPWVHSAEVTRRRRNGPVGRQSGMVDASAGHATSWRSMQISIITDFRNIERTGDSPFLCKFSLKK